MLKKWLAVEEASSTKRVFGLDFIRAAAIGLVLIAHGFEFFNPYVSTNKYTHFAGVLGVELFFVLSGFLIGTILLKTFHKEERFTFRTLKDFWVRRWFRTLPLYYLVLFLNFVLAYFLLNQLSFDWRFLVFSQNVVSLHPHTFDEAWSLSVEEWFYLSFPFLMLVFARLLPFKDKKQSFLFFIVLFLLLVTSLRGGILYFNHDLPWDNGVRRLALLRLDSILVGVFASYIYFHFPKFWERNRYRFVLYSLVPLGVLTYFFVYDIIPNGFSGAGLLTKTLFFPALSLFFVCFLPLANSINPQRRNFFMRFITHLSVISYSVYLLHFSVVMTLQNYIYEPASFSEALLAVAIFYAVTFWVSTLVYNFYEKPCTRLRDKFSVSSLKQAITFK
jgi:peptidoglycan/LPS O-acetylase OafA/YrhL